MKTADLIVLIAAVITLITALVPFGRWLWRTYLVRNFDGKKAHFNRLIDDAKWFEDRFDRLDTLRKQLVIAKASEMQLDRFKLSGMISKLDRKDAEWASRIENLDVLIDACERKQDECQRNAEQCYEFAGDVERKVLFW